MSTLKDRIKEIFRNQFQPPSTYRIGFVTDLNDDGTVKVDLDGQPVIANPLFPVNKGREVMLIMSAGKIDALPTKPNASDITFVTPPYFSGGALRIITDETLQGTPGASPIFRFQDQGNANLYRFTVSDIIGGDLVTVRLVFSKNGQYFAFIVKDRNPSDATIQPLYMRSYSLGQKLNSTDVIDQSLKIFNLKPKLKEVAIGYINSNVNIPQNYNDVAVGNDGSLYQLRFDGTDSQQQFPNPVPGGFNSLLQLTGRFTTYESFAFVLTNNVDFNVIESFGDRPVEAFAPLPSGTSNSLVSRFGAFFLERVQSDPNPPFPSYSVGFSVPWIKNSPAVGALPPGKFIYHDSGDGYWPGLSFDIDTTGQHFAPGTYTGTVSVTYNFAGQPATTDVFEITLYVFISNSTKWSIIKTKDGTSSVQVSSNFLNTNPHKSSNNLFITDALKNIVSGENANTLSLDYIDLTGGNSSVFASLVKNNFGFVPPKSTITNDSFLSELNFNFTPGDDKIQVMRYKISKQTVSAFFFVQTALDLNFDVLANSGSLGVNPFLMIGDSAGFIVDGNLRACKVKIKKDPDTGIITATVDLTGIKGFTPGFDPQPDTTIVRSLPADRTVGQRQTVLVMGFVQ